MDKNRKREFKKLGKALVEESSKELNQKLHERNPFPITDPRWAENLKEEYYKNRAYRQNKSEVLIEAEVVKDAYIEVVDADITEGLVPSADWYLMCLKCRHIIPTTALCDLACSCGEIVIIPEIRFLQLPKREDFQIVKIIGKGSIRPVSGTKSWWKFW